MFTNDILKNLSLSGMNNEALTRRSHAFLQLGIILATFSIISRFNFPLFHTLVELSSVVVAFAIFIMIWNSRNYLDNNFYLILGISFFFVGALDLFHALSYPGINILPISSVNSSTQFWLQARMLSSISFLIAPFFADKKLKPQSLFLGYLVLFTFFLYIIFANHVFPTVYIPGQGLTPFAKVAEYWIIVSYLSSVYVLHSNRRNFDARVIKLLTGALVISAATELIFARNVGTQNLADMLGHLLKVVSFYMLYLGIIEVGLMKPYRVLFKNLQDNQGALKESENRYRSLAADLEKFQLAVKNASDSIIITDPSGLIIYANKSASNMTGYSVSEMIGKTPALWGQQMESEFYRELWRKIKDQKTSFRAELTNRRRTGEKFVADLHISPVLDDIGNVQFFVAIERDITKAKEVDRAKTEFVSLASHQLRTPLTSISLSAELLLRGMNGSADDKQKKYLFEIYNSTKRMGELIDALLNISRIELGTFTVKTEPTDLVQFIDKVIDELTLQINKKKIKLVKLYSDDISMIEFDKHILRMTVENLVTNAIKYTPEGGTITISLDKENGAIVLKVNDTGCGIPQEAKGKIFSKLYRAENAREISADGAGLGLYIVKSVIEKTGSKIWFESSEGKGSTFYVSIPTK